MKNDDKYHNFETLRKNDLKCNRFAEDEECSLNSIMSITLLVLLVFFSISLLCENDDDIVREGGEGVGKL